MKNLPAKMEWVTFKRQGESGVLKEIDAHNLDEVLEQLTVWKNAFSHSLEYQSLTEEAQDEAAAVIMGFGEYMYSFQGLRPAEWESEALTHCCTQDLPKWMVAESSFFDLLPTILHAFFQYLGRENHILQSEKLQATLFSCSEDITKNAQDPARWSQEKFYVLTAALEGHDLNNSEQLDDFVRSYEEQFQSFSHF